MSRARIQSGAEETRSAATLQSRCNYPKPAFTLIEVVAVVLAVGLLVGMVQPSLEEIRQRSKLAVCLNRLGAIGAASQVYTQRDPNGWGIPVHPRQFGRCPGQVPEDSCSPIFVGAYAWGGKSGVGNSWHFGSWDYPLGSRYGTKAGFGPAARPLNQILYPHGFRDNLSPAFDPAGATLDTQLKLDAYRCPADAYPPPAAHCNQWTCCSESSYDYFGTSYAANVFMMIRPGGSEILSNSPYLRPLSEVPNPARTIFYEENIGRWAWAVKRDPCDRFNGVDPGWRKALPGWHGKNWTYNRSFGDAHAETQSVYIEGTEDEEGYAEHYRVEQVFKDPTEQEKYKCFIVRGDGWQKDTLPAPPIPTGRITGGAGRVAYEGCVADSP